MKYNLLRFNTFVVIISSFFLSLPVFAEPIDPSQCLKIVASSNSTSTGIALARSVADKLPTYENATDLTLWYSKNNGATWTRWTDPSVRISFNECSPDKTILLKGDNPHGFGHPKGNSSWRFINSGSYTYTFSGNIMAIIDTLNLDGSRPIPAYCFDMLFTNFGSYLGAGTDLVLPAQELSEGCYFQMFKGCTSITKTPDLSVSTNAPIYSMQGMFQGCTALNTVQGLPQTDTIGEEAMLNMFYNCTALNSANVPTIKAKYIDRYGCHQMFALCSSANFVTPPTMPNLRNIAERGCEKMYFQCTNLTSSTCLNHLEVVKPYGCYLMFDSCLKMTTIDTLKARRLEDHACARMFYKTSYKTSASTKAKAIIVDTVGMYGCYQMFHGNFTTPSNHYDNALTAIDSLRFRIIEDHGCEQMCYMCTLQLKTIPNMRGIKRVGAYGCSQMFYNSLSTQSEPYDSRCGFIRATTIEDHGLRRFCYHTSYTNKITSIAGFEADSIGNLGCEEMFRYCNQLDTILSNEIVCHHPGPNAFQYAFANCGKLRTAPNLPAEKIVNGSYGYMFYNCDGLVYPPSIAATQVGESSCIQMFYDCDNLLTCPQLFAQKMANYCYSEMFRGCDKLTTACELPATELASYCYNLMFYQCSSLTHAPFELPATEAADHCYYDMFAYCNNIGFTQAPEIKLEKVAYACCRYMFYECSNLTDITHELPASSLASYCYSEMFYNCTKITKSPVIYAQNCRDTLGNYVDYAFYRMFYGCTSLQEIKTYQREWYASNNYDWTYDVPQTGDFHCVKDLPREYGTSRIPKNTTYPWNIHILTHMLFDVNGGTWDGTNTDIKSLTPPLSYMPMPMKENSMFVRWDTLPNGQGHFALNWRQPLEGDYTYYAIYEPAGQFVDYAWRDKSLVIRTTRTDITSFTTCFQNDSVEKINTACQLPGQCNEYLLAFDSAGLQKNLGKLLNVMLKNYTGDTLGYVSLRVPYIIRGDVHSSTLVATDNADVWVTKGGVFTVDDVRKVRTLYVTGGGKAIVPEGKTLRTDNIVLSAGRLHLDGTYEFAYPQLIANGSIINASGKVNYDHLTSTNQNYALCLPYTVNLGDVLQENGKYAVTPKKNSSYIAVEYYDGETRLKGGNTTGWKKYFDPAVANSEPYKDLKAGVGYTFYGRGPQYTMEGSSTKYRNAYATFRFPMAIDLTQGEQVVGDSKTISVTPWGFENGEKVDSLKVNDVGWNLVGNPFLADVTISGGLSETNGI